MTRFTALTAASLVLAAASAHAQEPERYEEPRDDFAYDTPSSPSRTPTRVVEPERPREPLPTRVETRREDDTPAPIDERTIAGWDHFELSMGFLAGQHRLHRARWSGASNVDPSVFGREPFDRVEGYGLRYDLRLVVAHVRMTAGIDLPFASYDVDATRTTIEGVRTEVPELKLFGFHFGIGAEYPLGPVAPFVDVLGGLDWATATIDRGGDPVEVEARDFGFRVRAGLRLHVRKWFFASMSGEVGLTGQPSWAAELSVGFALLAGRDQR
ncbi:MAG: hypothetical protein R3B99_10855 [Polyangiales bacterium]|nr:hypothetical protein [Myxococcales bacterium]MCB9601699.1 hypothetical protein [Sandaracinus sp.]MCB9623987.1 hypothetical protein [Sandaracinus sp.]